MPQSASQGDEVDLSAREGRSQNKPMGATRRDLVRLFGLAALSALAPLALAGEAKSQSQPVGPDPCSPAATAGAKPPRAKPICVPIAIPERRTRVSNTSA